MDFGSADKKVQKISVKIEKLSKISSNKPKDFKKIFYEVFSRVFQEIEWSKITL
jgi:hypothetical protein